MGWPGIGQEQDDKPMTCRKRFPRPGYRHLPRTIFSPPISYSWHPTRSRIHWIDGGPSPDYPRPEHHLGTSYS